jgi:hypothetical protein
MFFAIAVLLIHPQLSTTLALSAESTANRPPAAIVASANSVSADPFNVENSSPSASATFEAAAQPAIESSAVLPDEPLPMAAIAPAPLAFIKPGKPFTVSVAELRAENRRKELMWRGLIIASSGAATFDAWSTRHAITTAGAQELNPLLKPFAGNASLYAAIQVGPALLDFAGRKMMYSRHSWVRNMWWVPQSASFVSSMFCGAHNLAYH